MMFMGMTKICKKYEITKEFEDLGFHDDIIQKVEIDLENAKAIITIQTLDWNPFDNQHKDPLPKELKDQLGVNEGCYGSKGKLVQIEATIEEVLELNFENMQCATEISEVVVYSTKDEFKILTVVTIMGRIELKVKDYTIKDVAIKKVNKKHAHNRNTK